MRRTQRWKWVKIIIMHITQNAVLPGQKRILIFESPTCEMDGAVETWSDREWDTSTWFAINGNTIIVCDGRAWPRLVNSKYIIKMHFIIHECVQSESDRRSHERQLISIRWMNGLCSIIFIFIGFSILHCASAAIISYWPGMQIPIECLHHLFKIVTTIAGICLSLMQFITERNLRAAILPITIDRMLGISIFHIWFFFSSNIDSIQSE